MEDDLECYQKPEMNMEEKTIAELWDEANGILRFSIPYLERLLDSEYSIGNATREAYRQHLANCNERLQELRQQLLERAYLVKDAEGFCTRFEIYMEQGVSNPNTYIHAIGGTRFDTQETAGNYIAAYAFWAWELEQRQKHH